MTLSFTINNSESTPALDLAFTDNLPQEIFVSENPNIINNCEGAVSAAAGGHTISFSGGRLGGSSSCSISVNVSADEAGTYTNTTGNLTSSAGDSGSASDDLTVSYGLPAFSKVFSPDSIFIGGRSRLTFTIDNSNNSNMILNTSFTDTLPNGLIIAEPANLVQTCGGTITAVSGTDSIAVTVPILTGNNACTIGVDVLANWSGDLHNISGQMTTTASGFAPSSPCGSASDTLEVTAAPLTLIEDFPEDPVNAGAETTLSFTISNHYRDGSVENIGFTDDLDEVLSGLVAMNTPLVDPCGAGSSLTGADVLVLSGGSLAPESSCTFNVTIKIPDGAAVGQYLNTTTAVTGEIDGSTVTGNPASEYLYLQPSPKLVKTFNPAQAVAGDTVDVEFKMTNTSSTDTATSITFTDTIFSGAIVTNRSIGSCTGATGLQDGTASFSIVNLGAGATCTSTLTLELAATLSSGIYDNTTSEVTGTVGGLNYIGSPGTASLTVYGPPLVQKSFTNDPVAPGGTVTLQYDITNRDAANGVTDISFTDDLEAALSGLTAIDLPKNDICGAGSSISGASELSFTNGNLGPGESCSFTVTLQTPDTAASGNYPSATSTITASAGGQSVNGSPASDDLMIGELSMTTSFTDDPVLPGGVVELQFVISNNSSTATATAVTFTDDLASVLSGLAPVSTPAVSNVCGSGSSLTWVVGNLILSGGTVDAQTSCTINVPLNVPADAASGEYLNRTSNFSGNLGSGVVSFLDAFDNLQVNGNLLELAKSFTDDPLPPGSDGTLQFTITNLDDTNTVTDITFTDDLDGALAGLEASGLPAGDVCGAGSQINGAGLLTLTGGSLAPGGSCTFSVTINVPSGATGGTTVTSTTSEVSGNVGTSSVVGPAASDDLTINDFAFSKSFGGPALQDGTTTLSFTIQNKNTSGTFESISFNDDLNGVISGMTATNTPLTEICGPDSLFSGTSTLTLGRGALGPGESCSFEVTVRVPGTATVGDYTSTTSALVTDIATLAEPASASLTVQPRFYTISGTLTDAKTGDPIQGATVSFSHDSSSVVTDADGEYSYSVQLGTKVTITPSKSEYASWSPPSVTYNNLGGDKTVNFAGTLKTFTISGQVTDGSDPVEDVTLTFSHDEGTTQTDASGNYSYTVDYGANTKVTPSKTGYLGWSPANATISNITGNLIRNFQGAIQTFSISGQLTDDTGPIEGATLTFSHDNGTAQTDSSGDYSYTVDYGTTTTVTPSDTRYSSWSPSTRNLTNVTTGQSGQDFTGSLASFDLTVVKAGEGEGAVTSNPAGIECGSTCTAGYLYGTTVTLTATPESGFYFAGWSGDDCSGADTCQVLVDGDLSVTATFSPSPRADLAVTKDTSTYSPGLGGNISFRVGVTNKGPEDAAGVVVTDLLPGGLTYLSDSSGGTYNAATGVWTVGDLAIGETADLVINALYDTENVLTNTAQVTHSISFDPNSSNDAASVTIDAEADLADLAVWKLGVPKSIEEGDDLVYFITVTNLGPAQATNVNLTDVIPSDITGVQYKISGSGTDYAAWPADNVVSLGTLDPSASKTIWVRGQVAGTPADGILANTADVSTDTPDPVTGNNASTDRIRVLDPAPACDLAVVKSVDPETAAPGDTLVVTLTVINNGPDDAENASVVDLLHHGLTYVSDDGGGTYHPRTGIWSVGGLADSDSATLNITAEVNADGVIDNTASITGSNGLDPNLANNSSTAAVNGSGGPDLGLWSELTGPGDSGLDEMMLANGDRFTYVLHYENNGAASASDVQIQVTLPAGVEVIGDVAGTGCYDSTANIWHVNDALACDDSLDNETDAVRNGSGSTLNLTLEVTDYGSVGAGHVTAQIIEPSGDPDITNNNVTRALDPDGEFLVDLSVNVAAGVTAIKGRQTAVITVTVRNNGPDAASSVRVRNQMPPELTLVSTHPFQGTYRSDSGTWLVGNLAAGATATLELTVTPTATAESATVSAEVSGVAETELNTGNNSRQLDIKVQKSSGQGGSNDGGCFLDNLLCR